MYPSSCDFYIYNINSRVRCFGWLFICFTWERCDMSSKIKRSTRLVATFKNRKDKDPKTNLTQDVESVHLVEKLHQGSLDLSVGAGALRKPTKRPTWLNFQNLAYACFLDDLSTKGLILNRVEERPNRFDRQDRYPLEGLLGWVHFFVVLGCH